MAEQLPWAEVCDKFNRSRSPRGKQIMTTMFDEKSFEEKVEFVYKLFDEEGFFGTYERNTGKSAEEAAKFRQEANLSLLATRHIEAARLYTECVSLAPPDSQELALAYGNRSCALWEVGRGISALIDINRSLKMETCPDYLKPKLHHRKKLCIEQIRVEESMRELCQRLSKLEILQSDPSNGEADVDIDNHEEANYDIITDYNYKWKFRLPTIESPQELLPNTSNKIKLHYTEEYGVHMVATQDIKPGELLITARPLASSLFPARYHTHCSNCFMRSEVMVACRTCKLVMFCSERCRIDAVNRFHRVECEILAFALKLGKNREELLALRLLLIVTKQGLALNEMMSHDIYKHPFKRTERNLNEKFDPNDYINFHNLEDNFQKMPEGKQLERTAMAAMLVHILKHSSFFDEAHRENEISSEEPRSGWTDVERFAGCLILKILLVVECNCQNIKERTDFGLVTSLKDNAMTHVADIGCGLFTLLSLINHSCDSNVFRLSYKNNAVVHALHPITAGQQIFDEYLCHYLNDSWTKRQDFLRDHYYFKCVCPACVGNWPIYTKLPHENRKLVSKNVNLNKLKKSRRRFRMIMQQSEAGALVIHELPFFCSFLTMLHNCVEKPWYEHAECQELIRRSIEHTAINRYMHFDIIY